MVLALAVAQRHGVTQSPYFFYTIFGNVVSFCRSYLNQNCKDFQDLSVFLRVLLAEKASKTLRKGEVYNKPPCNSVSSVVKKMWYEQITPPSIAKTAFHTTAGSALLPFSTRPHANRTPAPRLYEVPECCSRGESSSIGAR